MRAEAAGLPRCTVMFLGMMTSVQHPGRAVFHRLSGPLPPSAGEQRVRRDDDGRVRDVALPSSVTGDHRRLGQRDLPGKDLHALNAHGAVACLCGSQVRQRRKGRMVLSSCSDRAQEGASMERSAAVPVSSVIQLQR